jgi:hypothetical protein
MADVREGGSCYAAQVDPTMIPKTLIFDVNYKRLKPGYFILCRRISDISSRNAYSPFITIQEMIRERRVELSVSNNPKRLWKKTESIIESSPRRIGEEFEGDVRRARVPRVSSVSKLDRHW